MRHALVAFLASVPLALPAAAAPAPRTCPRDPELGTVAFVRSGSLRLASLGDCRERTLVARGVHGPVRFSPDGRYVAFAGGVVPSTGGAVLRGGSGAWAPRGHRLAALTPKGGLVLGPPGGAARRLLADGFGVQSLAFDPSGRRLAVGRALFRGTQPPRSREIWVLDLERATRRLVYRVPKASARTPVVTGWAPGGFVLFTLPLLPAISINLDGLPLVAVPARGGAAKGIVRSALTYEEFVEVCGNDLVVAAGPGRYTTVGKSLVAARPPSWRTRTLAGARALSWVSPACSPKGRTLAASAGPNGRPPRFGLERRGLWLLSLDGRERRRLTAPARGSSDELPRWSADGRSLLFVRSGPTRPNATATGVLYLRRLAGALIGPIVQLGVTSNYYGRYGWAAQTDWHR